MAQPYEQSSRSLKKRQIIVNNFIGGLFWALGATVGLSIVITILGIVAHMIDVVPIIGTFISQIINFILATNPHLQ
jgi:hypothetical protein